MTPRELIRNYPVLHHMAERNAWDSIQRIGLRTTEQLVEACDVSPVLRAEILNKRRKRSYQLAHPVVGNVTVRDQKPLMLHNLEPALVDTTVEGFLVLLNTRVFMWTHPSRLSKLLGATAYRDSVHDVLVLDTERVVDAYRENIRLTGMNTGATIFPKAPRRGNESFLSIENFPFVERRRGRSLRDNVVELCVIGGIDKVEDVVVRVERRKGDVVTELVYEA